MFWYYVVPYIFLLAIVSIWTNKKEKDQSNYAMAGRKIGWFSIFSSVFTLIGAGELMTVAALGFINSGAAITLLAGYGIGMVVLGLTAKLSEKDSSGHYYYSLPDMIYKKFGPMAGLISNLLTISAFFALLILQLYAGGILISELSSVPYLVAIILCAVIVGGYIMVSGFKGVIITDKIQLFLMLFGLPILLFITVKNSDQLSLITQLDFSVFSAVSVLLTGVFVVLGSGDIWQRIYAAKSTKSVKIGMISAGVGFALYSIVLAMVGIIARENGVTDNPDLAFMSLVLSHQADAVIGIVLLAVFSAILSTADTEVYLISSLFANERRRWGKRTDVVDSSELTKKEVNTIVPFVIILAIAASYYAESLVSIYEILLLLLLAISPLVIVIPFREIKKGHATIVLILGLIALISVALLPFLSIDLAALVIVPGLFYGFLFSKKRTF